MNTQQDFACLAEDERRYALTFEVFERKSAAGREFNSWIQQDFPGLVPQQLQKTCSSDKVRLLGIGSGTGKLDKLITHQFQPYFPAISNHVVEPNKEHITSYQTMTSECGSGLEGISYEWYNATFDEFKVNQMSNTQKFHFISAIHSLYYVDDPEAALTYLYDLLEKGGKLLILTQAEQSGLTRLVTRLRDVFPDPADLLDVATVIRNHLQKHKIDHEARIFQSFSDVTACYQGTDESYLLMEFITHIANYKSSVPIEKHHEVLNLLKSEQFSQVNGKQVLLDSNEVVFVITKSK